MGRSPCCSKQGLNRGTWTEKEDMILSEYIRLHGNGGWRNLPQKAGLKRCGKSYRLRWTNYLRPDIKRGNISPDEEDLIVRMRRLLGNRWSLIAGRLPGRTDNEIKNYWNTRLSKKPLSVNDPQPKSSAQNLRTSSKSPPLHNQGFKTTPVKTTAVRYSEIVRSNRCNAYGRSDCSSDKTFTLSIVKENPNAITHDASQHIAFGMADVNLLETEAGNSTCSVWSLEEERSPDFDYFAEDTATFAESLLELNELLSPDSCLL
eukprot:PITA_00869